MVLELINNYLGILHISIFCKSSTSCLLKIYSLLKSFMQFKKKPLRSVALIKVLVPSQPPKTFCWILYKSVLKLWYYSCSSHTYIFVFETTKMLEYRLSYILKYHIYKITFPNFCKILDLVLNLLLSLLPVESKENVL